MPLTFHSYPPMAIPPAAAVPAMPTKCPLPMLLANREAPIWKKKEQDLVLHSCFEKNHIHLAFSTQAYLSLDRDKNNWQTTALTTFKSPSYSPLSTIPQNLRLQPLYLKQEEYNAAKEMIFQMRQTGYGTNTDFQIFAKLDWHWLIPKQLDKRTVVWLAQGGNNKCMPTCQTSTPSTSY